MSAAVAANQMRRCFAEALHRKMGQDRRLWLVTGDLGYRMWDAVRRDYPRRFINVGAAEQTLVGLSIGLALEGKIPFAYSITPFLLYRPFESLRNYLDREGIPVKLVGSGRDRDYAHDGFSHWSEEDRAVMAVLGRIRARWPDTVEEIPTLLDEMVEHQVPCYINLRR